MSQGCLLLFFIYYMKIYKKNCTIRWDITFYTLHRHSHVLDGGLAVKGQIKLSRPRGLLHLSRLFILPTSIPLLQTYNFPYKSIQSFLERSTTPSLPSSLSNLDCSCFVHTRRIPSRVVVDTIVGASHAIDDLRRPFSILSA